MKIIDWSSLDAAGQRAALARPAQESRQDLVNSVREIVETVRREGDDALRAYSRKFDKAELGDLKVSPRRIRGGPQVADEHADRGDRARDRERSHVPRSAAARSAVDRDDAGRAL